MNETQVLLLLMAGLGTWLFFQQKKSGEMGQLINTLNKLKDLSEKSDKTEDELKAEEANRQKLVDKLNELAKDASIEDIKKFFNKPNKP